MKTAARRSARPTLERDGVEGEGRTAWCCLSLRGGLNVKGSRAAERAAHPGARGPPWRASDEMALAAGVGPGIVGACYPGNFSTGRRGRWVQS